MGWRELADLALSSLLAPPCASCGRVLDSPLAGAVCGGCWTAITRITPPVCEACGAPVPSAALADALGGRCVTCRRRPPVVDCARAIGSYEGTLRRIVHALKYEGRRSVVPGLARAMRESGALVLSGVDALVPVPLHPLRWRARGFNQADDLARAIGLPMLRLLRRAAHTPPQVDLPADARWRNVEGAFTLSRGFHRSVGLRHAGFSSDARSGLSGASGLVLVLIDDVATTGATLEACARVLKAAGAREVRALTAARVVTVHH